MQGLCCCLPRPAQYLRARCSPKQLRLPMLLLPLALALVLALLLPLALVLAPVLAPALRELMASAYWIVQTVEVGR